MKVRAGNSCSHLGSDHVKLGLEIHVVVLGSDHVKLGLYHI